MKLAEPRRRRGCQNFITMPLQRQIIFVMVAMAVSVLLPAAEPAGGSILLRDFKMRGVKTDGQPHWDLFGQAADVHGVMADIRGIRLLLYLDGGDRMEITSPSCRFDRVGKIGESDAEIKVRGQRLEMEGIGYNLLAEAQSLTVRSRVRMLIFRLPPPVAAPAPNK